MKRVYFARSGYDRAICFNVLPFSFAWGRCVWVTPGKWIRGCVLGIGLGWLVVRVVLWGKEIE